ncbi:MAG: ABC transporter substrate-binding protein [Acidimicrobiia bacterium]
MRRQWFGAALAGMMFVAGCGDGSESSKASTSKGDANTSKGADGSDASTVKLPPCPVKAADGKTVTVKLWHSLQRANEDGIKELVKRFEAANPNITIELTALGTYDALLTKWRSGLEGNGDLPDAVQLEDKNVQLAADLDAVLPMQSCVNADTFDLKQLNQRAVDFLTIDKVMYGMPFNLSNPVLYYDKTDFKAAGLDPEKPPTTLDGILDAAKKLKDSGIAEPLSFETDAWYLEQWRALSNKLFVDHDNGRNGRATKVAFDDAEGKAVFEWAGKLHDAKISSAYPVDGFEHLLALGNGTASMTIDSSTVLGTALPLLNGHGLADKEIELGVAALPSVNSDRSGGVTAGGANMYIMKNAAPEKQAAAYTFLKYLTSAESQAWWSAQTGYLPVNVASQDDATLKAALEATPVYKVAPKQLADSPSGPATAGIALGAYPEVRDAISEGLTKVINEGADPAATLADVVRKSNAAIADYNQRLGL